MDNTKINSYKDLIVWQKAIDLVVAVYAFTRDFPKEELYGLVSQMRRCAVSIPSNIAEGRTRGSRKDFRQFLIIAFASGAELETQLIISKKLEYGNIDEYVKIDNLLAEVMKMLNRMTSNLEAKS